MPAKVVLKLTKGTLSDKKNEANHFLFDPEKKEFSIDQKEILILGRLDDTNIEILESTVSRYHCLIDIAPPAVVVRDFGSLNGTFLNGVKIGQRNPDMSLEEARQQHYNEFPLKAGDRLGLGADCEFTVDIIMPQYCADCFCEIDKPKYFDKYNQPICSKCHIAAENKRKKGGIEGEKAKNNKPKCRVCGATLNPGEPEICPSCQQNPIKVLEYLVNKAQDEKMGDAKMIAGYRTIKTLGKGGMGEVWLVEDRDGKQFALKLMLPKAAGNKSSRDLFMREAFVAGQLDHKNVVKQFSCGQSDGTYFIILEFCNGGSVDRLMDKNGGRLSIDLATYIILQTLDGFEYVHKVKLASVLANKEQVSSEGIVHRDFKPGNIFLTGDAGHPTAKVADFGLAKAFATAGLSGLTHAGVCAGTPVFMPRQQVIDFRYAKPEVDVWAAAASYYNMLTGNFPKDFVSNRDLIQQALANRAIPIRKRNSSIPSKLAEVIDAALVDNPNIGIRTAKELKDGIRAAIR